MRDWGIVAGIQCRTNLASRLAGLNPTQHRCKLYFIRALREDWRARVPDGFALARIDEQIFQSELTGGDVMREWVLGSCSLATVFAARENGFLKFDIVKLGIEL